MSFHRALCVPRSTEGPRTTDGQSLEPISKSLPAPLLTLSKFPGHQGLSSDFGDGGGGIRSLSIRTGGGGPGGDGRSDADAATAGGTRDGMGYGVSGGGG